VAKPQLAKLELEVMKRIWARQRATVRDVWEDLYPATSLAYTTVATVIRKIEQKGFVAHEAEDRTYVYYPTVAQDDASSNMARDLVERVFDGSPTRLVRALIDSGDLSDEELAELQQLVDTWRNRKTSDD
jgi:BlaI family transcriptional regulator, penicillinase repressor